MCGYLKGGGAGGWVDIWPDHFDQVVLRETFVPVGSENLQ
jgi:hypothetical protein